MFRIFSRFIIFMVVLALSSFSAYAQERGHGKGKGIGKGKNRSGKACINKFDPRLTFIFNEQEHWTLTPDEVLELPGNFEIAKGSDNKRKAIKLMALLPAEWSGGRVSFYSCNGQRINVPGPHLETQKGRYIISKNRKGFLKLSIKKEDAERVIMRDIRRIDVR